MSQDKDTEIKSEIQKLYEQILAGANQGTISVPNDLKDSFLQLETLEEDEQVALIKKLDKMEGLPKPMLRFIELIKLQQLPLFEVVPEEVLNHMYEFNDLNKDETTLSTLALTSKAHYKLFQSDRMFTKFQQQVAYGEQDKVEALFALLEKQKRNDDIQTLLCKDGTFTDYSGRSFHCTSYEYAYWAKDTHMCRMLERHMDENTKSFMLKRCEAIEKDGLSYTQNGQKHCTKHFDLTPLKTALQEYVDGCNNWYNTKNWDAMKAAWMKVGVAQRDVPAHVIHEYCRHDRSFEKPTFKEDKLPRVVQFYNYLTGTTAMLFSLVISSSLVLGVDFALIRENQNECAGGGCPLTYPLANARAARHLVDLLAVGRLDEVRTEDLKQSLENLKPMEQEHKLGF